MNRLKNKKGETLIESLVAFAILAVIMIGFPILIVNVNKLNKAVKDHNISYNIENAESIDSSKVEVTIKYGADIYKYSDVYGYKDSKEGFYFYGHEDYDAGE